MAKIVILGGSGFIGTHLNLHLQQTNHIVKSIDVVTPKLVGLLGNHTAVEIVDGLRSYHLDGADYVVWAAGLVSHTEGQQMILAYYRNNIEGLLNVVGICRGLRKSPKIIYLSTTSLYGPQPDDISLESVPDPLDVYSATKLAGEYLLNVYRRMGDIRACILRLPNCYGLFGRPEAKYGVANHWLALAERGEPLMVYGSGDQERSFLYVKDAVRAISSLFWDPIGQTKAFEPVRAFDVLPDQSHTIRELAIAIAQTYKVRVEYVDWPGDRRSTEIGGHTFAESTKDRFRAISGWEPLYNLKQGIQEIYEDSDNRRIGSHRQRVDPSRQVA